MGNQFASGVWKPSVRYVGSGRRKKEVTADPLLCFLIGLDKQTGDIAWKKDRPIGTAHATPLLVKHHGQTDILVPGKNRLTAFDAHTHAELWQYGEGEGPFNGEIIVSPVSGDGLVFLQLWRQSQIHAIRLAGDVSNNDGTTFVVQAGTTPELLTTNELAERITASPAISGNDVIYRTDSHLYCIGQER